MKITSLFLQSGSPLNRVSKGQKSEIAALILTVMTILTAVFTSLIVN